MGKPKASKPKPILAKLADMFGGKPLHPKRIEGNTDAPEFGTKRTRK